MVEIPRSSFIPKEASGMTPSRVRHRRTFHIFGFISTALLVGSLISAGLVLFLERSATASLEAVQNELVKQEDLFDPTRIAEVRNFDRQIQVANILIDNHISPLKILTALEAATKQRVQLTSFTVEHTPSEEVLVTVQGITPEFRMLALQESAFAGNNILKDIVFSEVSTTEGTEETGGQRMVTFTLEGILSPSAILYDGQSTAAVEQTSFAEPDAETIEVVDTTGTEEAVLGESITIDALSL